MVSPCTTGSLAGLIGCAPLEAMTCSRLVTVFCHLVTRPCTELCCCELRKVASLFSLMTEIWLLISDSKIRSTIGVEMRLPIRIASTSRGAAMSHLRLRSCGNEVTSQRSIPMITRPHSSAIGTAAYACTPIALVSANHMDTTAMPAVINIAQPMLWNLIRSPGQSARISDLAPDNVIKNWPGFDICRCRPLRRRLAEPSAYAKRRGRYQ